MFIELFFFLNTPPFQKWSLMPFLLDEDWVSEDSLLTEGLLCEFEGEIIRRASVWFSIRSTALGQKVNCHVVRALKQPVEWPTLGTNCALLPKPKTNLLAMFVSHEN